MAPYCQRFQKSTVSTVELTVESTIDSNANVIMRQQLKQINIVFGKAYQAPKPVELAFELTVESTVNSTAS